MKTLDEVIAELEDEGLFEDALHYLKEYRETKKHLACLDDAEIRGDNTQVVNNPPLTWGELKSMEGKPVWVEVDEKYEGWVMVGKFYSLLENEDLDAHVNLYYFGRSMEYSKEMYGYYWKAYRKERE